MAERCLGCMQMKENHPVCEHCGYDERTKNSDHQLPVGTVLGGQYIIGKALGQGGFGITYLAWDQVMNQPVAVKEYFPKGFASRTVGNTKVTSYDGQNANDFEFNKKRFLREAESLAKLWNVPQIVKILRYFEENGTAYIVMEYVQGVDLRKHLKKLGRPLTVEETLALMGPVAEGLGLAHKINLVHRDISPDNIMVLPDGSTKLLDFGAARYVENANADKERLTSTQAILKHGFAPPEQYRTHGALGPWTDEYALCATIYYCISGRIPTEAMARTMDGEPIDWNAARGLSSEKKAALEKGMALQPRERFSSVGELWKALTPEPPKTPETDRKKKPEKQKFTEPPKPSKTKKQRIPVKQEQPAPAAKKQPRKSKGILALAAAVVVAVLFFGSRGEKVASSAESPETFAPVREAAPIPTRTVPERAPSVNLDGIDLVYTENESGWTITGFEGDRQNLPEILVLPREKEGKPVTAIGGYAFRACSRVISVTIPDGVTYIGSAAFDSCSGLKIVNIHDRVTSIGIGAFSGCSSLTSVNIPDSVAVIDEWVFSGCTSLFSVIIPDGVASIGEWAFSGCSALTGVSIPDSVTSIGEFAFSDCSSLTSVYVPANCEIADGAFPDTCTVKRR